MRSCFGIWGTNNVCRSDTGYRVLPAKDAVLSALPFAYLVCPLIQKVLQKKLPDITFSSQCNLVTTVRNFQSISGLLAAEAWYSKVQLTSKRKNIRSFVYETWLQSHLA